MGFITLRSLSALITIIIALTVDGQGTSTVAIGNTHSTTSMTNITTETSSDASTNVTGVTTETTVGTDTTPTASSAASSSSETTMTSTSMTTGRSPTATIGGTTPGPANPTTPIPHTSISVAMSTLPTTLLHSSAWTTTPMSTTMYSTTSMTSIIPTANTSPSLNVTVYPNVTSPIEQTTPDTTNITMETTSDATTTPLGITTETAVGTDTTLTASTAATTTSPGVTTGTAVGTDTTLIASTAATTTSPGVTTGTAVGTDTTLIASTAATTTSPGVTTETAVGTDTILTASTAATTTSPGVTTETAVGTDTTLTASTTVSSSSETTMTSPMMSEGTPTATIGGTTPGSASPTTPITHTRTSVATSSLPTTSPHSSAWTTTPMNTTMSANSTLSTPPTKEPTISPEATTTPLLCLNGGSVIDGICICPDEWTGETCSQANFCPAQTLGELDFPQTLIGQFGYSTELCESGTSNAGISKAAARCVINEAASPAFSPPQFVPCTLTFDNIQQNVSGATLEERQQLVTSTQIMTSRPQQLTAQNISAAAQITTSILSLDVTEDIAAAAITTVSQLLGARVDQFPEEDNTSNALTESLESFSLGQNSNVPLLVQPNLAVQSLQVPGGQTKGVQLTVLTGQTDTFAAHRIQVNANISAQTSSNAASDIQILIMFPEGRGYQQADVSVGFVLYENDVFFRSRTFQSSLGSKRRVISGNVQGSILPQDVDFQLRTRTVSNTTLRDFACVFWDYEMRDWSTRGCSKVLNSSSDQLRCRCNHTTNFAILVMVQNDYRYAEALNWISSVGCILSVVGLVITIAFQILTRKSRKRNPTLLLVSICVCMTISYLLFLTGVVNPNQQPEVPEVLEENVLPPSELHQEPDQGPCTAVAALLQYFLLATFTWNTLYAAHVFLLFRKAIAGPPQWFFRFSLLTGWGVPALLVLISLAATYRVSSPLGYRQEEFCWLAALDSEGNFDARKPMLWGFLLPLGLMLCFNISLLAYYCYTTWQTGPDLRSTKVASFRKKLLSSFSLAVVLGISWVLGYFLLITQTNGTLQMILSVAFCVFNTTQGLQIFILFTASTSAFKKVAKSILGSIPIPSISLHRGSFDVMKHYEKSSECSSSTEIYTSSQSLCETSSL